MHLCKHMKEKLGIEECKIFKLHLDFSVDEENNHYSEDEQSHNPNTDEHKKFSCKLCNKTFFLENYLIFHLRFHTKEKYLLCHLCGRMYSNDHYFKMHLLGHRKVKPVISSLSQTTLLVEEVAQLLPKELLTTELLIPVKQEVAESLLKELLMSESQTTATVIQEIPCEELLVNKHSPRPFDHMQSRNPVEPCQGAATVSNSNRTEIRKINPLGCAKMVSYIPKSEFSYIPEQGLSGSNVFDQALSRGSIPVMGADFSVHVSLLSSDSNQDVVNGLPQLDASGQTYSEESVLVLHPPHFGEISYSHPSAVTDATGKKMYCCVVCKKTFTFVCHLNEHLRIHWHKKLPTCKFCQREFSKQKELHQHICDCMITKEFTCDVCHKVFIRERALNLHALIHTTPHASFVCSVCEELFQLKRLLYAHIRRAHKRKEHFYCNLCKMQYPSVDTLQVHDCGTIEKTNYVCDVCDANFRDKTTLLLHQCPYAVKDVCLCDTCQRTLNSRSLSPNQDMYACNLCDETFSQKSDLRDHLRDRAQGQVYSCSRCTEKFTNKCSLDFHARKYHRSKLLSCTICERKFANDATFQKHVNSHLDKEPYECQFCDKIFLRKHNLTSHMHTHDNE